jgi:UDP-2,3-diacylglucosamine hydrolase
MHKTIFISDLHLAKSQPELTQIFNKFVSYCLTEADTHTIDSIYILGDFFNYWIGNDSITPWHQEIITALKKIAARTKIYFLVGNRDFQINNQTAKIFNFELITDDIKQINIYGQDAIILHGDTLCTHDIKYQKFRKIVRTKIARIIYLALPLKIRQSIAEGIKKQSKRNYDIYVKNPAIFDAVESEVLQLFTQYNSPTMIHGHTHKPKIHKYKNNNIDQYRYVLGDWHKNGAYYLEITHNTENKQTDFELKFFQ